MITKMLCELKDGDLELLLSRDVGISEVLSVVNEIVMEVENKGDEALYAYTEKFEGAILDDLQVSEEEIDAAYDQVEERLMEALADAADNIFQFHNQQKQHELWMTEIAPGVSVGQKVVPLDSVGAYVPGGRASYPSSALMNVILMAFNLIPIPPLDGSRIVANFLGGRLYWNYMRLERYGMMIVFGLLFLGVISRLLYPVMILGIRFLGIATYFY